MIRVNLLPVELRPKEVKRFKLPPFVSPKGLLCFLISVVCVEILMVAHQLLFGEPRFQRLQAEYQTLSSPLKAVRDIKDKVSGAQEVNRELQRWMEPKISWTAFMNALVNGMEKGIWLTEIKFERRDYEAPEPPERARAASQGTNVNTAVAAAQKLATRMPAASGPAALEKRVVLVMRGRVAVEQDEAAVVSRFMQNLKAQPAIADMAEDFYLNEIRRDTEAAMPMFDFVVLAVIKRDKEKEFFNLS
jgi:Tfp pilus assembly protein PilN